MTTCVWVYTEIYLHKCLFGTFGNAREQIQSLCVVLGTIMTEGCRSSCRTYPFSQGKAIPHLENVCRGYLMHLVTL